MSSTNSPISPPARKTPGSTLRSQGVSSSNLMSSPVHPSPAASITSSPASSSSTNKPQPTSPSPSAYVRRPLQRLMRFQEILSQEMADVGLLYNLAWTGCPPQIRMQVWQLLLGYLPVNRSRREDSLSRKRIEYRALCKQYTSYLSPSDSPRNTAAAASASSSPSPHRPSPPTVPPTPDSNGHSLKSSPASPSSSLSSTSPSSSSDVPSPGVDFHSLSSSTSSSLSKFERQTLQQIRLDLPRTCPSVSLFRQPAVLSVCSSSTLSPAFID